MDFNTYVNEQSEDTLQALINKLADDELVELVSNLSDDSLKVMVSKITNDILIRISEVLSKKEEPNSKPPEVEKKVVDKIEYTTIENKDSLIDLVMNKAYEVTETNGETTLIWGNGIKIRK